MHQNLPILRAYSYDHLFALVQNMPNKSKPPHSQCTVNFILSIHCNTELMIPSICDTEKM